MAQSGYWRYSFDLQKTENRHITIKEWVTTNKQTLQQNHQANKKKQAFKKAERKTEKHTYKIQTKAVRKRMKETRNLAEAYNEGKVPLKIKVKRLIP